MLDMTTTSTYAPAVFAEHASPKVSGSYSFIPTFKIVETLEDEGYMLHRAEQKRTRLVDNRIFAKHILRFRRDGQQQVNGLFPEIILINSHNTSTALRFAGGFFRMVCSNGLVTGDMLADMKVYHTSNNTAKDVIDKARRLFEYVDGKLETVRQMADTIIGYEDRYNMAYEASKLFPERSLKDASQLLHANRVEDAYGTVWHTFNRIQENIKRGMFEVVGQKGNIRKARTLKNIDRDLEYNQRLWKIAESYL